MLTRSPTAILLPAWQKLSTLPAGRWLFSRLVGLIIPYTGTMRADVLSLKPGHARVALKDRRRVRNHLNSVHAIALANLAEYTTGLATLSGMPEDARAILVGLSIEYQHKARGRIVAECSAPIPSTNEAQDYRVSVSLTDAANTIVATAEARWLVGPVKSDHREAA